MGREHRHRHHPSADAAERSTPWLTPAYAAIATGPLPGGSGADWNELAAHQGCMTVTVESGDEVVGDRPVDTTATATRVRILTLTPGADGWIGERCHLVATLTLTRANDSSVWLVAAITLDELLAGMPDSDVQDFG